MARGISGFADELVAQRGVLAEREPVYARLLDRLHALVDGELAPRLEACWAEREFEAFYERPLLLLAGLRYEALRSGPAHPLHAALAAATPDPSAVTDEAVSAALSASRTQLYAALRERYVQTNETSRSITWLLPSHLLFRAGVRRPLSLVDLGTSAGLNLIGDELPPMWHDEQGQPIPTAPLPEVCARLGLDRAPLDVQDEDTADWLRACVWPSDRARLSRLELGIARIRERAAVGSAPCLLRVALPDCGEPLAALPKEPLIVCIQTIVRDYMPEAERVLRYEQALQQFLRSRPLGALVCELELRPSGTSMDDAAALAVRFSDGRDELRDLVLARTHPHPKTLRTDPHAMAELIASFQARN